MSQARVMRERHGSPLVRSLRPRQWIKNLLVLAAPVAAGALVDADVLLPTGLMLVAFCAASSAVYLANDVLDAEADRRHPRKRNRPVAAGELTASSALVAAGALAAGAVLLCLLINLGSVVLIAGYLLLNVAYGLALKKEPVLDLVVVACGFLLRAVAGGVASGLPISDWFLLVAGFGSLFIVAGKRYSELTAVGVDAGTRASLVRYSESYLRFVWGVAAATTVIGYCLWAFGEAASSGQVWFSMSIVPFVVGVLRYAVDIDLGRAGEPEDIIWSDRALQAIGVAWLLTVCLGIFLA